VEHTWLCDELTHGAECELCKQTQGAMDWSKTLRTYASRYAVDIVLMVGVGILSLYIGHTSSLEQIGTTPMIGDGLCICVLAPVVLPSVHVSPLAWRSIE